MYAFALSSLRRHAVPLLAALVIIVVPFLKAQDDPPPEVGRLSSVSGTVSIQPMGAQDWGQAYPNLTIGPGDRIYTDSDGRAEIQLGQTYARIGPNTDVTLVDDTQFGVTFGVAQGFLHLHSLALWPRQLMNVSTPNGSAGFDNAGELRVDVYPTDGATVFTNLGNFADITAADEFRQELDSGQSLQLSGSNPVYPQWLQPAQPDDLDYWSRQRDQQLARIASYQYVSPDIPGAADLDAYGQWEPETEYGAIWYPREVPADWVPYHYGHWISRDPWGWVWVEDEPWGYAPFHYGRWVFYRNRWGWVPGPVRVRPVWSPALVVFAGGVGSGVSAWIPLGPGEPYRPWYRCSPRYIDQVNITNIREAPRVQVQRTYVNVVNTNITNITYVNQSRGITAMRHEDFASGRDARTAVVRVDPRQVQHVQPISKPDVAPTQRSIITRPTAHPVHVSAERPMLINQQGNMIAARPGATPVQAPVSPAPPVKPVPGRTVIAAPAHANPASPVGRPSPPAPVQQEHQNPNQPAPYPGGHPAPAPQRPPEPQHHPVPIEPQDRPTPPNANQPPERYSHPPSSPQQEQPNPNQPAPYPGGRPAPAPQRPEQPQYRPAPPNTNAPQRYPNPPQERPQPPQRTEPAPPPQHPESRPAPPPPNRQQYVPPPQNRQERQPPPAKNDDKNNKEKQDNKKPHD